MLGGNGYGMVPSAMDPVEEGIAVSTPTAMGGGTNMEENTKGAHKPGSIVWWSLLLGLYLLWDYFANREKLRAAIEPANIRTNWYNIIWATVAVVLGVNFFNILLTKLAAMRIPLLSKAAGAMLPLFHL